MIFYSAKLHLSKSSSLLVFSIKQNINFKFQFVFFYHKKVAISDVRPLNVFRNITYHCPTLTVASFAST
jgi:hypothetical protein